MVKRGRQIYSRTPRKLFIGEWLARTGRKPVELAKAVDISEQYVSELVGNKKKNPSIALLLEISDWLGLTVNDLYRAPPPRSSIEAVERLNPSQIAVLGRLLDEMKGGGRK